MPAAGPNVDEPRAGARVLDLLASPLHVRIVQAHADGHLRLAQLHEKTELPAQTTLRAAVGTLRDFGVLSQRQVSRMPYGIATELTDAGREVLFVVEVLDRWLAESPQGPISINSDAAKAAIKSLAGAWNSTMIRELAYEPASLTDLDRRIGEMSYPSIERRLARMRSTRQVEPSPAEGRGQPFEVTDWLRHALAPLCASARCERRFMREESAPVTAVEIEAAFLLVVPIAPLPKSATGTCLLSVPADGESRGDPNHNVSGASVEVDRGIVVRCVPELEKGIATWALGSPTTWLNAVIDGKLDNLRLGGVKPQLASDLVQGIHAALFGP